MSIEFKKLSDVETVEELSENAMGLYVDDGKIVKNNVNDFKYIIDIVLNPIRDENTNIAGFEIESFQSNKKNISPTLVFNTIKDKELLLFRILVHYGEDYGGDNYLQTTSLEAYNYDDMGGISAYCYYSYYFLIDLDTDTIECYR